MNDDWPKRLVDWYRANARDLPWRATRDPYPIWVSEIMAQQTRIDTVIPYYERFLDRFPDVEALARAPLQSVLKSWEGLGYYSRARNLHRAANLVLSDYDGRLPNDYESLQELPGLGPYTAAAVASFAFGEPVPVVDGNVLRVFTRFFGIETDIRKPAARREIFDRLTPAIRGVDPSDFNQGIMELGALVCTPRDPGCERCPLRKECVALREDRVGELPYKSPAARVPHHEVAVGVIVRRGKILIARRRTDQMLGGLWEFPGGKREPSETLEEATRREVEEETGLDVDVRRRIATVKHTYSHFKITLTAFLCESTRGRARAVHSDAVKWVHPGELDRYPFPKASLKVIECLRKLLDEPVRER